MERVECQPYPSSETVVEYERNDCYNSGGGLEDVLAANLSKGANRKLFINVKATEYRRIENEQAILASLERQEAFRANTAKWFKTRLRRKTACMIVGLLLCEDPQINELEEEVEE